MLWARKPNNCFRKHTDDWSRFSWRYSRVKLSQEICAPECEPLAERSPANICRSCVARRDSNELMPHLAFSKNSAAHPALRKKMENTSSTATAVQSPLQRQIIPKHVSWPNLC